MRVLVIGGGAREHALVARCVSERDVDEVLAVPGNPGIGRLAHLVRADVTEPHTLLDLAETHQIDLTIVGPEVPLSFGLVDAFVAAGRLIVGPTRVAAQLETSKAFAKHFMERHGVPTARFRSCDTAEMALAHARSGELGFPLVIKADGLAAGKGVTIATDLADAEAAIRQAMTEQRFGPAGSRVVLEECLQGPEVSFFALCDGARALPVGTAQDHKRIYDGDRGPNTGGMGAFAPSPLVDGPLHDRVMREIVNPVVQGMAREGCPFSGFLYVGLMITATGPKVIEFNVRLGDPEAQVILDLIDEPLLPLLVASASGCLRQSAVRMARGARVGVVIASRGYPESSAADQPIDGLEAAERLPGVSVFHAGTAKRGGRVVTAGGRVLTIVGGGPDYATAIERAYAGVSAISFDGMQFRRDIGQKALASSSRT
jgi:phosphoribosylamine---glycine ligase